VHLSEEQTRSVGLLFITTTQNTERRHICCFEIGDFLISLPEVIWIEVRWSSRATAHQSACCRLADLTSLLSTKRSLQYGHCIALHYILVHSVFFIPVTKDAAIQNILRHKSARLLYVHLLHTRFYSFYYFLSTVFYSKSSNIIWGSFWRILTVSQCLFGRNMSFSDKLFVKHGPEASLRFITYSKQIIWLLNPTELYAGGSQTLHVLSMRVWMGSIGLLLWTRQWTTRIRRRPVAFSPLQLLKKYPVSRSKFSVLF
jgi:hypothetical protein